MKSLCNKRIILGISGGIAAYKSAEIVRCLKKKGADVRVVMTQAACKFITPLTLQALSHYPVHTQLLDTATESGMGHIELARWADRVLIAPASADLIANLASGHGKDLLTTLCLATESPICIAPAMNKIMWQNPQTKKNCTTLKTNGILIFGPIQGEQACGDIGLGCMCEPQELVTLLEDSFKHQLLAGAHVTITAGPTVEAIDPVRFITNRSSGKMGYALAEALINTGAIVTLISGPVHITVPDRVHCIPVVSGRDMHQAVQNIIPKTNIFIGCAAVCDYRPDHLLNKKLKKEDIGKEMTLNLIANPDIISTVSQCTSPPFVIGFSAETHNMLAFARAKKQKKQLNMIIANDVSNPDFGFGSDFNKITVITDENEVAIAAATKIVLANKLTQMIASYYLKWK